MIWALLKDLKIQELLRHGKGLKSIKKLRWKNSELEVKVVKTGMSGFGYQSI
jgi:hypothetical protein